ncbi:hypothetical protein GGTG_10426 [Gaeumannomyces tritici R3-111a-1]|uniref:Uncharacterized protein n=1 Tax=Gaeumannomyces tritici (strain R3-111a-1) TaxID=644352 RepID=J3PAA0_GAET3|nr:hypothetical protein GGTG_10426 [Gaeumannomyces tritici R3-111a-1]EJT71166.1 hypothetical protein GGTG_10426 [Gaeumannomyces tritici R3-111a-1]
MHNNTDLADFCNFACVYCTKRPSLAACKAKITCPQSSPYVVVIVQAQGKAREGRAGKLLPASLGASSVSRKAKKSSYWAFQYSRKHLKTVARSPLNLLIKSFILACKDLTIEMAFKGLEPFFVYTIRKGSEKVVPSLKEGLKGFVPYPITAGARLFLCAGEKGLGFGKHVYINVPFAKELRHRVQPCIASIAYKKESSFSLFTNTVAKEKLFRINKIPHILSMGKLNLLHKAKLALSINKGYGMPGDYIEKLLNWRAPGQFAPSLARIRPSQTCKNFRLKLEKAAGSSAKGWLCLTSLHFLQFGFLKYVMLVKLLHIEIIILKIKNITPLKHPL